MPTEEIRRRLADIAGQRKQAQWQAFRAWVVSRIVDAPLKATMPPTPLRQKLLGAAILFGQPLFYYLWTKVLPQPYDSLVLRLAAAATGLLFFSRHALPRLPSLRSAVVINLVYWFSLPFTFWWLYLHNGGNAVWLASVAGIIVVYYWVTDWRIATLGVLLAAALGLIGFELATANADLLASGLRRRNLAVIGFFLAVSVVLSLTRANLRPKQLESTLTTMGIMAHELRTPLATISLIADSLRMTASELDGPQAAQLTATAERLQNLARSMNHQIETQIANARLMRLPDTREAILASDVVHRCVDNYPFRSARERDCVEVVVQNDFHFIGSTALFVQVLDNLISNALRALAATSRALRQGDLLLAVDVRADHGCIYVSDTGSGMSASVRNRLFEPFSSSDARTGHGLGLAFCKRVVDAAGGTIEVLSEQGKGTTFMLRLPLAHLPPSTAAAPLGDGDTNS